MIGRNPLWVATQHGHSIATMLRAYAAWTEGAVEGEVDAIKQAMAASPRMTAQTTRHQVPTPKEQPMTLPDPTLASEELRGLKFGTGFGTNHPRQRGKCSKRRAVAGGERGIRTRASDFMDQ